MLNTLIIIPTYNEAENIPVLAEHLKASVDGSCDILIMDDSPSSETIMEAEKQNWRYVWRTHNASEKGLSPSVVEGIARAKREGYEQVIVMDADLQHPPRTARLIQATLNLGYDFVVASRYVAGGGTRGWSFKRRIISKAANLIAMPLMLFKIHDMMSGFFGFKVSGLPELSTVQAKGYKICTELMVKGDWENIKEIPYTFGNREKGESKLSGSVIGQFIEQLIRLYLYKFRMLKFTLVGLSGVAVNLGMLVLLAEILSMNYLTAASIAFVASVTNNYTWNYLWTFRDKKTGQYSGWLKYLIMAGVTYIAYIGAMAIFTEWLGIWYILSASVAIVLTFLMRYTIASNYIWKPLEKTKEV